jgi:hypothetical protein
MAADVAAKLVPAGDRVFIRMGSATPLKLVGAVKG